ncbi:unnamed protein product [Adineta ricciae]|uniref:Uncharacterized protein n=1 Tax=Adineta ricciae TaxID=249248 RepID=A0A815A0C5_ADIRI|nr:unnamed protein product [Adineta ricciae]
MKFIVEKHVVSSVAIISNPNVFRQSIPKRNALRATINLSNITDELRRKHEFDRRFNAIRLDRQSFNTCDQRKTILPRAPPVTLYEKSTFIDELLHKQTGIYGPYVQLAENHHRHRAFPSWYKGPGHFQEKSILESLFTRSSRYKGKFLPLPKANATHSKPSPGPTTYFKEFPSSSTNDKKNNSFIGFLSSTERFPQRKISFLHLGPASYNSHTCSYACTKRKQTNRHL